MTRSLAALLLVGAISGTTHANAKDIAPGPGRFEVSVIPGGAVFFTENTGAQEPSFGNYDAGAAVTVNFNRYIGVEGEVSGAFGVTQSLPFGGVTSDQRPPHMLNYSGNLVVSAPTRRSESSGAEMAVRPGLLLLIVSTVQRARLELLTGRFQTRPRQLRAFGSTG